MQDLLASQNSKIFFPRNKLRNFQHYFEIEFLSSPKKMKNCIPSHLFVNMWLQKLSWCYVSLSDWLTTIFVNPWKNQKYLFIINLFTSLLQMKLFLRNNSVFTKKCTVEESISSCGCAAAFRSSRLEGLQKVHLTIWWEKPLKIPTEKFIF